MEIILIGLDAIDRPKSLKLPLAKECRASRLVGSTRSTPAFTEQWSSPELLGIISPTEPHVADMPSATKTEDVEVDGLIQDPSLYLFVISSQHKLALKKGCASNHLESDQGLERAIITSTFSEQALQAMIFTGLFS